MWGSMVPFGYYLYMKSVLHAKSDYNYIQLYDAARVDCNK